MIDVKTAHLEIVANILKKYVPDILCNLFEAFQESDLPFRVDLLDWHALSPEFRQVIKEKGYAAIQHPHTHIVPASV